MPRWRESRATPAARCARESGTPLQYPSPTRTATVAGRASSSWVLLGVWAPGCRCPVFDDQGLGARRSLAVPMNVRARHRGARERARLSVALDVQPAEGDPTPGEELLEVVHAGGRTLPPHRA